MGSASPRQDPKRRLEGWAAAAASGLLLTAAFPRIDVSPAAFVALVPLLVAVGRRGPTGSLRLGWMAGMVHFLTLLHWVVHTMRTYGQLPLYLCVPVLFLLAAYLSLYPAVFALLLARLRPPPWALAPVAAGVWTGLEYLRTVVLTGFPWALLGYSQHARPALIQIADVTGVYGLSFFVVLVNGATATVWLAVTGGAWQAKGVSRRAAAGAALGCAVVAAGLWAYGQWRLDTVTRRAAEAPRRAVAVVQGNIDQARKWDPAMQRHSLDKYLALSRRVLAEAPDLVVWPETATPFYLFHDQPLSDILRTAVREADTAFLVGSPSFRLRGEAVDYYNTAFLLGPDGGPRGRYDKVHLVPFGEYVPLQRFLPFVGKMVAQVGDFKPGLPGATLDWDGRRLGVQICYEIIFPRLAREMTATGAELLVNVTNDAWFARTGAPYQHFAMAALRAVENRRALVRAANTGISGVVDPAGRVTVSTDLFVDAAFSAEVPLLDGTTVYGRIGDLFALACLAAAVGGLAATFRRPAGDCQDRPG